MKERRSYIFVKWSSANERNISTKTNFWSNGQAVKKKQMKEGPIIWSNGRVQMKKINQ